MGALGGALDTETIRPRHEYSLEPRRCRRVGRGHCPRLRWLHERRPTPGRRPFAFVVLARGVDRCRRRLREKDGTSVAFCPAQAPRRRLTLRMGMGASYLGVMAERRWGRFAAPSVGVVGQRRRHPRGAYLLTARPAHHPRVDAERGWACRAWPERSPLAVRSLEQVALDGSVIDASWTSSAGVIARCTGRHRRGRSAVTMRHRRVALVRGAPDPRPDVGERPGASSAPVVIVGTVGGESSGAPLRSGALWQKRPDR